MDMFDMMLSKESRDEGLARVLRTDGKWSLVAGDYFHHLPNHIEVTGEDVRRMLTENGLPPPHHHNAWGAFIMHLVKSNMLVPTGRMAHMKMRSSHARRTPIYLINK